MTCRAPETEDREDVYDWVREYDYRVQPHQQHEESYWFAFGQDAVTYGRLQNKIHTQRNSKFRATGFLRPSEVEPCH